MDELRQKLAAYRPYLEEARRRLYLVTLTFAGLFVLGCVAAVPLFRLASRYLYIEGVQVVATSPFQLIDLMVSIGVFLGLICCLPLAFFHLYAFLRPGLTGAERRRLLLHVPAAAGLFALGFAYGFAVMYYAMGVIADINTSLGVRNYWDIGRFLSQAAVTSALLGAIFELPLLLNLLIRVGLLDVAQLRSKRRYAIAATFIFVALLPPTDGVSLVVMSVPLLLMYEATIFINRRRQPAPGPAVNHLSAS